MKATQHQVYTELRSAQKDLNDEVNKLELIHSQIQIIEIQLDSLDGKIEDLIECRKKMAKDMEDEKSMYSKKESLVKSKIRRCDELKDAFANMDKMRHENSDGSAVLSEQTLELICAYLFNPANDDLAMCLRRTCRAWNKAVDKYHAVTGSNFPDIKLHSCTTSCRVDRSIYRGNIMSLRLIEHSTHIKQIREHKIFFKSDQPMTSNMMWGVALVPMLKDPSKVVIILGNFFTEQDGAEFCYAYRVSCVGGGKRALNKWTKAKVCDVQYMRKTNDPRLFREIQSVVPMFKQGSKIKSKVYADEWTRFSDEPTVTSYLFDTDNLCLVPN